MKWRVWDITKGRTVDGEHGQEACLRWVVMGQF